MVPLGRGRFTGIDSLPKECLVYLILFWYICPFVHFHLSIFLSICPCYLILLFFFHQSTFWDSLLIEHMAACINSAAAYQRSFSQELLCCEAPLASSPDFRRSSRQAWRSPAVPTS